MDIVYKNIIVLYIDPGTGSMLIAVAMGIFATLIFALQGVLIKIKSLVGVKGRDLISKNKLNYVIYSDDKRYWNVFKPICDEFEKRAIEVNYWTQSPDDPALNEEYKNVKVQYIGKGNTGFAKLNTMNAHICLSTTPDLDVTSWKRSKNCDKYVHIFHEPGLNSGGYKMFGLDFYDAVLAVSEEQTIGYKELETKRGIKHKEYLIVGSTYLDDMQDKVNSLPKVNNTNKVILVATSWGVNSLLEKYGLEFIDNLKKTGYLIVVRPHPQMYSSNPKLMKELENRFLNDSQVEINTDNNNINVLNRADLMISDFSGIIFDFALVFDKPVMYIGMDRDLSTYDAAWFDDSKQYEKAMSLVAEEINESNISSLNDRIEQILNKDTMNIDDNIKNRFWQERGNAAKNVVDYLIKS